MTPIASQGAPSLAELSVDETAASITGLRSFFYQFHRDTRVADLVGDAVIAREQTPEGEVRRPAQA